MRDCKAAAKSNPHKDQLQGTAQRKNRSRHLACVYAVHCVDYVSLQLTECLTSALPSVKDNCTQKDSTDWMKRTYHWLRNLESLEHKHWSYALAD